MSAKKIKVTVSAPGEYLKPISFCVAAALNWSIQSERTCKALALVEMGNISVANSTSRT